MLAGRKRPNYSLIAPDWQPLTQEILLIGRNENQNDPLRAGFV